jgi:hypothetical protein
MPGNQNARYLQDGYRAYSRLRGTHRRARTPYNNQSFKKLLLKNTSMQTHVSATNSASYLPGTFYVNDCYNMAGLLQDSIRSTNTITATGSRLQLFMDNESANDTVYVRVMCIEQFGQTTGNNISADLFQSTSATNSVAEDFGTLANRTRLLKLIYTGSRRLYFDKTYKLTDITSTFDNHTRIIKTPFVKFPNRKVSYAGSGASAPSTDIDPRFVWCWFIENKNNTEAITVDIESRIHSTFKKL